MRKVATLLITLLFANLALAQNKPLACQVDAAAGLKWENGQWRIARFIEGKFILVLQGNTLTKESVAKVLDLRHPSQVTCSVEPLEKMITCADLSGGTLIFQPENLKGGTSHLFGSSESNDERDTISVEAFTCRPY
jgi:hypothetical protein